VLRNGFGVVRVVQEDIGCIEFPWRADLQAAVTRLLVEGAKPELVYIARNASVYHGHRFSLERAMSSKEEVQLNLDCGEGEEDNEVHDDSGNSNSSSGAKRRRIEATAPAALASQHSGSPGLTVTD
jgi:hypothetical protein